VFSCATQPDVEEEAFDNLYDIWPMLALKLFRSGAVEGHRLLLDQSDKFISSEGKIWLCWRTIVANRQPCQKKTQLSC